MESVESMKSAIDRVERLLAEGRCAFVAIDGPCASGKTVFAASLHERFGGNVLHMDTSSCDPNNVRLNVSQSLAAMSTVSGSKPKC